MQIKTSIAFAMGLGLSSTALAADLPMVAEPIEYVQACDAYGAGYFQLPGKDTCVRFKGRIRTQIVSGNLRDGKASDYSNYARAYLYFDSKTAAESFTISTHAMFYYTRSGSDSAAPGVKGDSTYVRLNNDNAELTLGRLGSLYTGFAGYAWMQLGGAGWSDNGTLQATLKVPIDNLTLGFSIEDSDYTKASGGQNYIAALEYSHSLFDVKLSGALTDRGEVEFTYDGVDYAGSQDEFGYAFNANVEFKPTDRLAVSLGGQYGYGASAFTGLDIAKYGIADAIRPVDSELADVVKDHMTSLLNYQGATSYALMGGVSYDLTDKLSFMLEGAYTGWNLDFANSGLEGHGYLVGSSLVYKPASGLGIALGAGFDSYTTEARVDNASASYSVENAKVGMRIQYSF